MLLGILRLGLVEFDLTFIFQIVNTLVLVLIIYLIYKFIRKVFGRNSKFETRISNLEDELKKIKENEQKL